MKKLLSLVAVVLALATCLTFTASAADKLTFIQATSDGASQPKAAATAAVSNLRAPDGLWFMADTSQAGTHPDSAVGERFLELTLEKVSTVDELKVQWYQGNKSDETFSVVDPADSRMRTYEFYITVSEDGKEWDLAWPKSGVTAKSGTGVDFETYAIAMQNVAYIRIHSNGSTGDTQGAGYNKYIAIRNVEAYGTATGAANQKGEDQVISGGNTNTGNNGGSTNAPTTGETISAGKMIAIVAVAAISCTAAVVIRKKIRER